MLNQLLRFVEGADMPVTLSQNDGDREKFEDIKFLSTKNMLIVFAGAFSWIEEEKSLGFLNSNNRELSHNQIENTGFSKEFLGRIKQIIVFDKLSEEDYSI